MSEWIWIGAVIWFGAACLVCAGVSKWFRWMREQDEIDERLRN